MEQVRYVSALIVIVAYPPVILFWFLLHPFARFWRGLGVGWSYAVLLPAVLGLSTVIFLLRGPILAVRFEANPWLDALAALAFVAGMLVEVLCRRHLSVTTLVGVPELRGNGRAGEMLTRGIYGRVRHPRYLGALLGLAAAALFSNHLAVHSLLIACVPAFYVLTVLEERELVDRFGEEYRVYRRTVPRFVPRLGQGIARGAGRPSSPERAEGHNRDEV